jgi:hypothetical protein
MNNYTIKPNQSLFDVAIEVYGDVQGVSWLLQDNPTIPGPTGPIEAGQIIQIREVTLNARQKSFLADFGPFQTIEEKHFPTGIGFWKLDQSEIS